VCGAEIGAAERAENRVSGSGAVSGGHRNRLCNERKVTGRAWGVGVA